MLTSETAKMTYTVVDGVTAYAIGFVYNTNPDGSPQIKVYKNKLSNTPLVYGVDYTLVENGTKIDIGDSAEQGDRLDIIRDIPLVQLSDFVVGRIDPEQIENDFDNSVMRDQQLHAEAQFIGEVPLDHETRIQECETDIDDIEALIPAQTTTSNQLADKNFVNSSISTATATFRGTYSSLVELEAVQNADLNDYGFVESTDAAGNTLYSRYKYDGTNWAFEYTLNNSSFTAAQWAALNSGITSELVATYYNTTGRNVGDVFFSMRTDNGLNGAVECNGATYSTTDFTGGDCIGAQLESGNLPYMSLSDYATALLADGSVGVFGWDGAGTTAFRVPSLNDIFIETGTAAQIGDYLAPGLPDHTHPVQYRKNDSSGNHADGNISPHIYTGSNLQGTVDTLGASGSNPIYGNSNTVQPNAVRYRAMVQLAVAATDEAVETCTAITAQVATNTSDISTLQGYDYVVESQLPTAQNGYTWYRKYKSGWVEQGGIDTTANDTTVTVNLPVTMADVNYVVQKTGVSSSTSTNTPSFRTYCIDNKTQTSFQTFANALSAGGFMWQVSGMAAQN